MGREEAHGRPLLGLAHAAGFLLLCRSPEPASHADETPIWSSGALRYPSHRRRRSLSRASSLKNLSWHAFEQNCRWYQRQRMRPHRVVPHWAHAFFIRLLRIHSFIRPPRMHAGGPNHPSDRRMEMRNRPFEFPSVFLHLRTGPATQRLALRPPRPRSHRRAAHPPLERLLRLAVFSKSWGEGLRTRCDG
jgi:hypothetical protein